MRNNGWTSDIYRPNEAFVQPFVISPDILSGGVGEGVEFRISNPYPRTSQCHVNNRSFRTKQTHTATHYTSRAEQVFCQIPDVGALVHTLGLRGVQQKCSGQPQAVHCERGRIENSEILARNVFCRGYKNMKMIRLIG